MSPTTTAGFTEGFENAPENEATQGALARKEAHSQQARSSATERQASWGRDAAFEEPLRPVWAFRLQSLIGRARALMSPGRFSE
jgi:hypothetical protein